MHAYFTETLCQWFPGSPVIHLVRDPRDVVASLQRMSWAPRSIVNNTMFWVRFNRAAEKSQHRPEYLRVYYEQLVANPERELVRICAHIGEDYSDTLLAADSSEPYSWPRSASGAVTTGRLGRWREQLAPDDVAVIDWIAGARLQAYGYSPGASSVSIAAATRAMIQAGVDLARRRLDQFPYKWVCWTQPTNLAAQEYCTYRDRWDAMFPGLQPLHARRDGVRR